MQQSKALYFFFFLILLFKSKNVGNSIKFYDHFRFVRIGHLWYELWPSNSRQSHQRPSKAARKWLCGILAHSRLSAVLRWSTLCYFLVRTLLSKMPQTQKSNGLRSEDFGGYCEVEMKRGTSILSHTWLTLANCGGAESYWNVHEMRPKCLSAQDFNTIFKTFSR